MFVLVIVVVFEFVCVHVIVFVFVFVHVLVFVFVNVLLVVFVFVLVFVFVFVSVCACACVRLFPCFAAFGPCLNTGAWTFKKRWLPVGLEKTWGPNLGEKKCRANKGSMGVWLKMKESGLPRSWLFFPIYQGAKSWVPVFQPQQYLNPHCFNGGN